MDLWKKVSDELPPKGMILCCGTQGGRFMGKYNGGYSIDEHGDSSCTAYDNFNRGPRRFVYWMPVPEPPEGLKP
jgi:hypothetical protein